MYPTDTDEYDVKHKIYVTLLSMNFSQKKNLPCHKPVA
jgi:hypothetical protein